MMGRVAKVLNFLKCARCHLQHWEWFVDHMWCSWSPNGVAEVWQWIQLNSVDVASWLGGRGRESVTILASRSLQPTPLWRACGVQGLTLHRTCFLWGSRRLQEAGCFGWVRRSPPAKRGWSTWEGQGEGAGRSWQFCDTWTFAIARAQTRWKRMVGKPRLRNLLKTDLEQCT